MMTISGKAAIAALALLLAAKGMAAAEGEPEGQLPACPENSQQYATQINHLFTTETKITDDTINDAKLLRLVCGDRYLTMYELANAWYQLSQRPELGLNDRGDTANLAMAITMEADNLPPVDHNYAVASEFREKVTNAVIYYMDLGGPVPAFLEKDGDLGTCSNSWGNIVQKVWYAYKKDPSGVARPRLMENASRSCADKPGLYVHNWFGELLQEQARNEADPDRAFELIKDAKATLLLYTGEDLEGAGWHEVNQAGLERDYAQIALATRGPSTVLTDAEIFAPENVGTDRALYDLAWKLNQVWQPVERLEDGSAAEGAVVGRMRTYYERVKLLDAPAKAAGIEAQRFLFKALKGHAEKDYRTRETADLPAPPRIVWAARDPDGNTPLTEPED